MSLSSLHQDLQIEYYAMMSRIVQFTRKNSIKNMSELKVPSHNSKKANMLLATVHVDKKNSNGVTAA